MATTLAACKVLLSKEIGDYWASATTGAGAAGGTTLVDTALQAKAADWIPDEAYDMITETGHAQINEERKISSLSTSTLTVLAHGGQIGSGVDYEVHRLFTPSEKRRALIDACKAIFPACFAQIRDETITWGNWLRNGDMELWAQSANPDNWTATTLTAAETTNRLYVWRGDSSCLLTGTGNLSQDQTTWPGWYDMAGETLVFSAQVWANTASMLRLTVYDGDTTTHSSYHAGNSKFDKLEVEYAVPDPPKEFEVRFTKDLAGNAYVDDARLIGGIRDRVIISDLSLAQNRPHAIYRQRYTDKDGEKWYLMRGWHVGSDGYLYRPGNSAWTDDFKMRVEGIGYLDFLASGVSSEAWTATVALDSPQTNILVAQAIVYLYRQMIAPDMLVLSAQRYREGLAYWEAELERRKRRYGMVPPPTTIHFTGDR